MAMKLGVSEDGKFLAQLRQRLHQYFTGRDLTLQLLNWAQLHVMVEKRQLSIIAKFLSASK
jgi:hypothetical protein